MDEEWGFIRCIDKDYFKMPSHETLTFGIQLKDTLGVSGALQLIANLTLLQR